MPQNPLAAHPYWRQLAIVAVAVPLFAVAAVLAFAWPSARVEPRDVPLGVVASGTATQQLAAGLDRAAPGGYELHLYPDTAAARQAIEDRDVYGALEISGNALTVYQASAASPTVAQTLSATAAGLARADGSSISSVRDVDVVPISADDPHGSVLAGALLPLTTGSILTAAVVMIFLPARPLWRRVLSLGVVAAVTALGVLLIAQGFLGALPGQPVATWASLALAIFSISSAVAGIVAVAGTAAMGLASLVMIFLGNAFAGTSTAPDLLPGAIHVIGQWLPPGAAVSLLRGTAYFGGRGIAEPIGVLVVWFVLGLAGMIAGHRKLVRIASEKERDAEPMKLTPIASVESANGHANGHEAPRHALTAAAR